MPGVDALKSIAPDDVFKDNPEFAENDPPVTPDKLGVGSESD